MKLLIFDFDGTIVDSKAAYYRFMEKYLFDYGFSKKEIDKTIDIGLNIAEGLKHLGFNWLETWILKRKIMKDVLNKARDIKKCKDVDSIRKLPGRKILISNSVSNFVFPLLKHLKLKKEFDEIYCAEKFKNKAEFIKNYLKERRIDRKEVYYIGDRVADVLVARKVGCKSVIVLGKCAWDSKKEILASKPDFVIDDIKEISEII